MTTYILQGPWYCTETQRQRKIEHLPHKRHTYRVRQAKVIACHSVRNAVAGVNRACAYTASGLPIKLGEPSFIWARGQTAAASLPAPEGRCSGLARRE